MVCDPWGVKLGLPHLREIMKKIQMLQSWGLIIVWRDIVPSFPQIYLFTLSTVLLASEICKLSRNLDNSVFWAVLY